MLCVNILGSEGIERLTSDVGLQASDIGTSDLGFIEVTVRVFPDTVFQTPCSLTESPGGGVPGQSKAAMRL